MSLRKSEHDECLLYFMYYHEYDFIPELEPDPPWKRIPQAHHRFLGGNLPRVIKKHQCPYCDAQLTERDLGKRKRPKNMQSLLNDWGHSGSQDCDTDLYLCPACGWWAVLQEEMTTCAARDGGSCLLAAVSVHWAKIKAFNLAHFDTPLRHLQAELAARSAMFQHRSGSYLAELMTAFLRNFFPCELRHLGRSQQDGGDTFLLNAGSPAVIRITRKDVAAGKGIELLSNIFGFALRENRYLGLVASYLERDFRGWKYQINAPAIVRDPFHLFSLDNYDALIHVLRLDVKTQIYQPWERIWNDRCAPYDNDELTMWKKKVTRHLRGEDILPSLQF